jgi:glycosyltransferase involved in cell wall biosynthesis
MNFLSVVIPTYNSEETIERCLKSLIYQTYQNFEICIVDGGSLDKTIDKASNFRSHFKNIRVISESDRGTYDAMNKGIDMARGDWLYFLGSDDEVLDEDVFADIFNKPISRKNEILYGNVRINGDTLWAKSGQLYDGLFDFEKLLSKNICHQAIFYRKELFQRWGNYKIQYPVCADWDLNIRFFARTKPVYLDRTVANFYGGGISSGTVDDPIRNDLEDLRKRALNAYQLYRITSFMKF